MNILTFISSCRASVNLFFSCRLILMSIFLFPSLFFRLFLFSDSVFWEKVWVAKEPIPFYCQIEYTVLESVLFRDQQFTEERFLKAKDCFIGYGIPCYWRKMHCGGSVSNILFIWLKLLELLINLVQNWLRICRNVMIGHTGTPMLLSKSLCNSDFVWMFNVKGSIFENYSPIVRRLINE